MNEADAIARELADLGKSDARILSRMEARMDRLDEDRAALEANRARRCELLIEAVALAADHIGGDVAVQVVEPKNR